ncbi:MAG: hypothetical protein ACK4E0_12475 [Chitinophagaceae bacterium]|jgi:hypothetical protein
MKSDENEKIPLFKSWRHWYWLVVIFLVAEIIFFNWLTRYFT